MVGETGESSKIDAQTEMRVQDGESTLIVKGKMRGTITENPQDGGNTPKWVHVVTGVSAVVLLVGGAIALFKINDARWFIGVLSFICAIALPLSTAFDKAQPQEPWFKSASAMALVISQCSGILAAALAMMAFISK